jgi:phage terminase large subunit-like protein
MCGFGLCLGDGRRRQMMRCWGDQQLATKQWKEDDEMCGFGLCLGDGRRRQMMRRCGD